ncbi:NB-ARC domain-containing protein [Microbacterium sp. 22215]|uniref:NB-ARC domain-containing protein n=1 Tax=Microbacterium sp. 22215 TaxID=3453893 RepID=UPI003F85F03C
MSRARLYVLIDAFEADLRASIERYLLDHLDENQIYTAGELAQIEGRRESLGDAESNASVHFLDLQTGIDVLARHKDLLPHELMVEFRDNLPLLPKLTPIRHRVMHGRPLADTDPTTAVDLLTGLRSRHWPDTKGVLKHLEVDPAWEPLFEKQSAPNERTLHNLPEVDYDETSFIGRKDLRVKLIDTLRRRRNPVTTLIGEGGIGKTALALDVAYELLDSDDNPYEAILWVSLKTEKLTAYGVEELRGAIRGVDSTIRELGRGLDSDFGGSLQELSDALDGIETLIIIDNLESAHGEEIVQMYDALPQSVTYLFTSRWGIGQLERTVPVLPLNETESELLLRKFASARDQRTLASLSPVAAKNTVKVLRYSPLAIRWFVLASEAGRIPLETLRDQSELLEFCVKNVVDTLTTDSRAVLDILRTLDRAISFDEFAVLTEMSVDALRRATQELTRGSLVLVEADAAGAIAGRLALTATARMFLQKPSVNTSFLSTVQKREREYRAALDAGGKNRRYPQVTPRDSNDNPAVFLLQSAENLSRTGNYAKAEVQVKRALSFNPEFSEVYRVWARLLAEQTQYEAAVSQLQSALSYAQDDASRARAHYEMADVLARNLRDTPGALPHAEKASSFEPCSDTHFLHGRILYWNGDYAGGQEELEMALDGASHRQAIAITTALVDSWGRWADTHLRDHEAEPALTKSLTGFHQGRALLEKYPRDGRLCNVTAECVLHAVRSLHRVPDHALARHSAALRQTGAFVLKHRGLIDSNKRRLLRDAFDRATFRDILGSETQRSLEHARGDLVASSQPAKR